MNLRGLWVKDGPCHKFHAALWVSLLLTLSCRVTTGFSHVRLWIIQILCSASWCIRSVFFYPPCRWEAKCILAGHYTANYCVLVSSVNWLVSPQWNWVLSDGLVDVCTVSLKAAAVTGLHFFRFDLSCFSFCRMACSQAALFNQENWRRKSH